MQIVNTSALQIQISALPGTPRVVASGNFATPHQLLDVIDKALPAYRLFVLNAQPGIPDREDVILETAFVGPAMRHSPRLRYLPARLSLVPRLFATALPPDIVCLHTSTPSGGAVSMGTEVNILPAAVEAVRRRGGLVIAQVNPRMPWTHGDGVLSLEHVDYAIEVDEPLTSPPPLTVSDDARIVGERIAARVHDGATLQMGIGEVPNATLSGLTSRQNLRVWSEMFSDGVLRLIDAGALDPESVVTASFAFGSQRLYDWINRNPQVRVLRTERTNDPTLIARNPAMTSVNSALQVDLYGQANAARINGRIYSGFGGQPDFIVGALHSPGGQAFIALRSWHPKADCSTIVPMVEEPITSFQHSAVVTEQGVAEVFGFDQREQARNLIEYAAHPEARDELWEEAEVLGLT